MEKIGFVYDPAYLRHDSGPRHPENPTRLKAILNHLDAIGFRQLLAFIQPDPAPVTWIHKVHSLEYIHRVEQCCMHGFTLLDSPDTGISTASYEIALLSAGGVLTAIDSVMKGTESRVFCAIRPPGHHAEGERAMGFCIFNNAAIGARYLQEKYSIERVLIIDWDGHHGNGTQWIFWEDPSVFYFSIHQYPHYPGTGSRLEKGAGAGQGYTLNIPLSPGCGDKEYIEAFNDFLWAAAITFSPQFILISAGFDAHQDDPLSGMMVTEDGFEDMTRIAVNIAQKHCQGKIVSILEGGYNLIALSHSIERHLSALKE
jgi:acetoin utilization deacetylase AcuC-like enzyme